MVFKKAAVISAILSAFSVGALAADVLPNTVVSANRFESIAAPGLNLSVIKAADIEQSPATNIQDLLRGIAGVQVIPMTGASGVDAQVDIRGFGEAAYANVVVLIDGVRVNPADSASPVWSQIPLAAIERIEVLKGSGTILYGDQATGGAINIITKKGGHNAASGYVTAGSFGHQEAGVSLSGANAQGYATLFARSLSTDGYRDNSGQKLGSVAGRVGTYIPLGEVFADYALFREDVRSPGALYRSGFDTNPRATRYPKDASLREGHRLTLGTKLGLADGVSFEAEATTAQDNTELNYLSSGVVGSRDRETQALTPRLRIQHGLAGLDSETVVGVDYYQGKIRGQSPEIGMTQSVDQTSTAYYVQNTTHLTKPLTLTTGYRHQTVRQTAYQSAVPSWFYPEMQGDSSRTREAFDVTLAYTQPSWSAYGKVGTTFRFANADELFGFDAVNYVPMFAGDIRPQHGSLIEFGAATKVGSQGLVRGSVFTMALTDEIGYDSYANGFGANVNFDKTRRNGLELEGSWKFSSTLSSSLSYHYLDAKFREGTYAGLEVPMVAKQKVTLQTTWDTGAKGRYSLFVNTVSDRKFAQDFDGSHGRVAGYTTVDLAGQWKLSPKATLTARVNNLFDQKYAAFAGYSSFKNDTFYMPADGRALFVTLGYAF